MREAAIGIRRHQYGAFNLVDAMRVHVGGIDVGGRVTVDVQVDYFRYVFVSSLQKTTRVMADNLGKRLKAISVFGMGILVGAALTIIIPE